jgi:hypothetical protein
MVVPLCLLSLWLALPLSAAGHGPGGDGGQPPGRGRWTGVYLHCSVRWSTLSAQRHGVAAGEPARADHGAVGRFEAVALLVFLTCGLP